MHRSGTSAVTGVLERLGCFVGAADSLMPAAPDNPRGFGERQDVFQLHEEVLGWLSAEWNTTGDLRLEDLSPTRRNEFETRARSILEELEPQRPWVLKDPRLCLLLPLWRPLLAEFTGVVVYRNPLQVAQSLKRRNGIPLAVGLALWEQHNLELIRHARRYPLVLVGFETLLKDPADTVQRLYEQLAHRPGHGLRPPREEEIRGFIDPTLSDSGADASASDHEVEPSQSALLSALQTGEILHQTWRPARGRSDDPSQGSPRS